MPLRRVHFEIGAVLAALAAFALMGSQLVGLEGWRLGNGLPVFGDFIAFWSGGWLALHGDVANVHDAQAIMAASHVAVPGQTGYFPWRSPPVFLLIMTPLAALPFWAAALLFFAASAAIYIYALMPYLRDRRAVLFALTTPTFVFHLGSVQLTPLVTGLYALALRWADKRPIAAGAAISVLAIKPHLAVLWPVFLICTGRWRVFGAAAAFTLALLFVTGMIFGLDVYPRFIANLGDAAVFLTARQLPPNTLGSLYGVLIAHGTAPQIAGLAQAISAASALVIAIIVFLRRDDFSATIALPAAALLMSPHLFFYDTLLLALPAAALAQAGVLRTREIALCVGAFLAGGLTLAVGFVFPLPLCWVAAWSFLLYAFALRPAESAALRLA